MASKLLHLVIILDNEKGHGGMKKGQRGTSECQMTFIVSQKQKPLTICQISSSFINEPKGNAF